MADLHCQTCGKVWTEADGPLYSSFYFSHPSHPKGSLLSVNQMIANGESLLTCPVDPIEPLDSAMQEASSGPRSSARVTGISTRGGWGRGGV